MLLLLPGIDQILNSTKNTSAYYHTVDSECNCRVKILFTYRYR